MTKDITRPMTNLEMTNLEILDGPNKATSEQPMTKKEAEKCAQEYFTVEQPNTNAMIIKTIRGLMTCVNNELEKLREGIIDQVPGDSVRKTRVLQALEEIDMFEKNTLFKLQKAFE